MVTWGALRRSMPSRAALVVSLTERSLGTCRVGGAGVGVDARQGETGELGEPCGVGVLGDDGEVLAVQAPDLEPAAPVG
jgi:hypothetical protein